MAKYTKEVTKQGDKEVVRYKDGDDYVPTNKVPTNVVNALNELKPGAAVDELGDYINPETDLDESEDEDAPDQDDNLNNQEDDEDDEEETPAPKPKAKKRRTRRVVEDDEDFETDDDGNEVGMGFPRHNGRTGDIFDVKVPHTHLRNVNGLMVPLSAVNALGDPKQDIAPKSDVEIYKRLQELGKV